MFYPRTETFEAWVLVNEPLSVQGQLRRWFYHFYLPGWAKFELENYAGRPSFGAFSRRCGPGMLPRPMPLTYPKRRKRLSWHLGFNTQKTHQNLRFHRSDWYENCLYGSEHGRGPLQLHMRFREYNVVYKCVVSRPNPPFTTRYRLSESSRVFSGRVQALFRIIDERRTAKRKSSR